MMRSVVFEDVGDVDTTERSVPEPGKGQALVKVAAAGVCAADLYTYQGRNPYISFPRVGGHEVSGRLEAYGPGTDGPALGSRVVVEPFVSCGNCYPCGIGKSNCCRRLEIMGIHFDGGFAEYLVCPVDRLHPIPEGLDYQKASFAEPVAIGLQAVRRADIKAGEHVLVLGAGPIGLAISEIARERGASVFITDIDKGRLAVAAEFGAQPLPAGDELLPRILEMTDGDGMPVVMEATGSAQVVESTIHLVAPGGRFVIVGVVKKGIDVSFPGLDFTRKEVTLLGSRASVDCFPESLDLIASGVMRYPDVATKFSLEDARDLFPRLSDGDASIHKAVFLTELGGME